MQSGAHLNGLAKEQYLSEPRSKREGSSSENSYGDAENDSDYDSQQSSPHELPEAQASVTFPQDGRNVISISNHIG